MKRNRNRDTVRVKKRKRENFGERWAQIEKLFRDRQKKQINSVWLRVAEKKKRFKIHINREKMRERTKDRKDEPKVTVRNGEWEQDNKNAQQGEHSSGKDHGSNSSDQRRFLTLSVQFISTPAEMLASICVKFPFFAASRKISAYTFHKSLNIDSMK